MQPKFSLLILQTSLLSVYFPVFLCLAQGKCSEYFGCGNLTFIRYPFWGGRREKSCGESDFNLVCQDDVPVIKISSLYYRVYEIDYSTRIIKAASKDLWNNTCASDLYNTTQDNLYFRIGSGEDEEITLFFNCTSNQVIPNQFSCDVGGVKTRNFFQTVGASADPGPNITCGESVYVPVNREAAQALRSTTDSPINALRAALASGFSIHWSWYMSCNIPPCSPPPTSSPVSRPSPFKESPSPTQPVTEHGPSRHGPATRSPDHLTPLGPASQGSIMSPVQSPSSTYGTQQHSNPTGNGQESRNSATPMGIIIGVTLGITGIVIVSTVIFCVFKGQCSKISGPNQEVNQDVEKFMWRRGSLAPKRYKYFEIKKITNSFSEKLGQGGYGRVYKGVLSDGSLVAVKVLIEIDDSNGEEFINEVASISRTSHINIVNLLGFCHDGKRRALVYEYMPNKSLDKFISNSGSSNADCYLEIEKLYKIAVGVAKGLEYLHTGCNTRIVHFDIKPQNILLDEDFSPKISDFGLAKLCKKKQSILSMLGARGTIGYIAPEIFSRNFGGVSHKSDVYSYGMMILEMAGAKDIEETDAIKSSENYFPDKLYEQIILDVARTRSSLDDFMIEEEEETRRKMLLVGFWCIQTNPSDRPSMSKVVEMLEGSIQSIQLPPKPILYCPNTLSGREISPSLSEYVETDNSAQG